MTVRPPKGVRSAGSLAGRVGRSHKERIGVVPRHDKHQGNKRMDGKKEVYRGRRGGGQSALYGGRGRKWWVFAWCLWESGL